MRWRLALLLVACGGPSNEMRAPSDPAFSTRANASSSAMEPDPKRDAPPSESVADQVGLASFYAKALNGKRTTNGERYDPRLFTAAHRKLPFGTWVEVRRPDTGRTVRVRINDRGPNGHASNRIIDLSQRAAEALDIIHEGVVLVELRVVSGP